MIKGKGIKMGVIDTIITIAFALYYIIPSISANYTFILPLVLGFAYIAFFTIKNNMKISKTIVKYIFLIAFIALIYMLFTDANSIAQDVASRGTKRFLSKFYQIFMMFLPILLLYRTEKNLTIKQKKIVLVISYLLYSYIMIITMKELMVDANITRSWSEFAESSSNNIGNYYFVYAVPVLIVLCTMIAVRTKKIGIKVLMVALIIYQMYFLLLAQYTLSIIIGIIGIGFEIYVNTEKKRNQYLVISAFIILLLLLPNILQFAVTHVPSEQMAIRLNELYNFFVGRDATGYNMNGRLTLYSDSIKAFFNSPIWGNRNLEFDGHATFLTVLSDTGLLGGVPLYYLYFSSNRRVRKLIQDRKKQYLPIFTMLVLMGFTNPIHTALPLMYATWFLAPLTISVYNEYERKQI